jgi:hypothetical protein
METCSPVPLLRLGPRISNRYVRATGNKPVTLTYTLRVKGAAKKLPLRYMGVQITLPPGARVVKTSPSSGGKAGVLVAVNGTVVTFHTLTLTGTKTQTFRVRLQLTPSFTITARDLRFQSQIFQNAYGLAAAPYCPVPARDAVVSVKYP